MHKLLFLVFSLPLVVNFCGVDDDFEDFNFDRFTGKVSDGIYFSQTDTIWIRGEASAYLIGQESGDSILENEPKFFLYPSFALARLIPPSYRVNAVWAIDEFEIIVKAGEIELPQCRSSYITYYAAYDEEQKKFLINIGLIPTRPGSYLISMKDITFTNELRNTHLLYNHLFSDDHLRIQWDRCGKIDGISMEFPEGNHLFRVR